MSAVKPSGFFPVLTTAKLGECRDFYTQHLGFTVVFETDWYIHLASAAGIQLGFLQPHHPTQPDFLQAAYAGDGIVYSFEVPDVDRAYAQMAASAIPIILPVRTERWGQRHFMIKDPSGLVIDIVQPSEPDAEYKDKYTG